ncbi:hypothetical protein E2C01_077745 [Portunus trituberculatus]|uniref:Uncharacterized protein n=1 Tax=Portunus trituberculatus TaxID=210409 RepID=A0A5B7IL35_PORTR|nr:hypothetical protein [Portunus trituberculatus]
MAEGGAARHTGSFVVPDRREVKGRRAAGLREGRSVLMRSAFFSSRHVGHLGVKPCCFTLPLPLCESACYSRSLLRGS